tara:strand:+ start:188 stop:553 length:366 start_codon:yes stop_codon:yes gene_type:complete
VTEKELMIKFNLLEKSFLKNIIQQQSFISDIMENQINIFERLNKLELQFINLEKKSRKLKMDDFRQKQIKELQSKIKYLRDGLNNIYQDLVSKPMKSRDYKDAMRLLKKTQDTLDYKEIQK